MGSKPSAQRRARHQARRPVSHSYSSTVLRRTSSRQVTSIDVLPDDVLLAIFEFLAPSGADYEKKKVEAWQSLAHVCRRWRGVIFESPHRLNLRLVCTPRTPARAMLDVWPALPIYIWYTDDYRTESVDNIVALVLEHGDRVYRIKLTHVPSLHLENVLVAMHEPLPELTDLQLHSPDQTTPVLPDSFLGGSAPRLKKLWLERIPFPGLPTLLLSATLLTTLYLDGIPHAGYISPEAIVTAFSTLTSLERLRLEFQSPRSRPDRTSRRPTRTVLPVLRYFEFRGLSEYLDDLVARIGAPRLSNLKITFFNDIVFDALQISQFIGRTPMLKTPTDAHVAFEVDAARIYLSSQTSDHGKLNVRILCSEPDWQVLSLGQVCTSSLPPFSTLEDLYVYEARYSQPNWQHDIENSLWLELLLQFTSVKNIYLSEEFAPRIVTALQELVGGRSTEVSPTLQNIFLEGLPPSGPIQEGIRQFVAALGHPIAVSRWDRDRTRF